MKVFAQPTSYSEMLQRIFYFTVATGILCTIILSAASPELRQLLESLDIEAEVGPFSGLKALYVLLPLAAGVISRMLRLHDRVSDILSIREHFDIRHFLSPLARKSGIELTERARQILRSQRDDAMRKSVYEFASFTDPVIDTQLVRTAADNWGWFWSLLESSIVFGITLAVLAAIRAWPWFDIVLACILFEILLLGALWCSCKRTAARQVRAILDDPERSKTIRDYFETLTSEDPAE